MAPTTNSADSSPERQRHEADWFDFGRLLSSIWQWRIAVLAVSVLGGAVGYVTAITRAPVFVGTERIAVLQAAGSGPAADAVARYQALLENEAVSAAAVKELSQTGLDVDTVRRSISSRLDASASQLIVQVNWSDPAVAGALTPRVARAALSLLRQQAAEQLSKSQAKQAQDFEDSKGRLGAARKALITFRQTQHVDLARVELKSLARRRLDFSKVSAQIPAERAILKMAQERLARTAATAPREPLDLLPDLLTEIAVESARLRTLRERLAKTPPTLFLSRGAELTDPSTPRIETPNAEYFSVAQQVATSEARLAGLEARRDYVMKNRSTRVLPAGLVDTDDFRVSANAETHADFANREYATVLQKVVTSEGRLAGLEAQLQYLAGVEQGAARAEWLREIAVFELRQAEVQADLNRAQQVHDRLSDALLQSQQALSAGSLLELIERPAAPGVMIGTSPIGAVARGVAMGLVLSVLVLLFAQGMTFSPFRRGA